MSGSFGSGEAEYIAGSHTAESVLGSQSGCNAVKMPTDFLEGLPSRRQVLRARTRGISETRGLIYVKGYLTLITFIVF